MTVKNFSSDYLNTLIDAATKSPRLRQHQNIHASYQDPCQRFFNAIGVDSYVRPHRHLLDPKSETLIAVRGLFALVVFDDEGAVQEVIRFGSKRYDGENSLSVGAELVPGAWHTLIALEPDSVLLELKAGPFDPNTIKEFAPWAPEEGSQKAAAYLTRLKTFLLDARS